MYGTSALVQSGSVLSTAILGALFATQADRRVASMSTFSVADSHLVGVDRRHSTVIGHQYSGRKTIRPPMEEPRGGILSGLYHCKDGWISIMGSGPRGLKTSESSSVIQHGWRTNDGTTQLIQMDPGCY